MKPLFKTGNGYQAANKKVATNLVEQLIAEGKVKPRFGSQWEAFASTTKNRRLMVTNANDLSVGVVDCQGFFVWQDDYDGRVMIINFPSHKDLRDLAVSNKRAFVEWSEIEKASMGKESFTCIK
jgi:hypothetical protein